MPDDGKAARAMDASGWLNTEWLSMKYDFKLEELGRVAARRGQTVAAASASRRT